MQFNTTATQADKAQYKHLDDLSSEDYKGLVAMLNKYEPILNNNKGCEKVFLKLAKNNGYHFPDSFSFFDFCIYMATVARVELIHKGEAVDDYEILETMGVNMLPYKR